MKALKTYDVCRENNNTLYKIDIIVSEVMDDKHKINISNIEINNMYRWYTCTKLQQILNVFTLMLNKMIPKTLLNHGLCCNGENYLRKLFVCTNFF